MKERQHHFFISYRWAQYKSEAKALFELAKSQGFSCWIDQENLFVPEQGSTQSNNLLLANHLSNAMSSCDYVIFFETVMQLMLVMNGRPQRHLSWQEQELGMAEQKRLVTLYHSSAPRSLAFGVSDSSEHYRDLAHALEITVAKFYGGKQNM
ncbi:hypothetical protein [Variovorax sp. PCZ-1]|uniref:hypothetical protein n=1 Tax=Variovorax sp. PCZ-1 TaxID=2835533 RepID=UPI001BCE126C|nr:hypothetical protein [Variovorax sp. PCZ-1]MBS7806151.1 toll/interleukin-1 receptor domain-containing protein [Variovorax sp. PCZ-1]